MANVSREPHQRFRCCVPGCRRLVEISQGIWTLPCCKVHGDKLPDRLYLAAFRASEGSPFDPAAVLKAALLVTAIQKALRKKGQR